jgi:NAD(P)-dependent dehydrogenase (short-subunit alcohol dehydrogenase family)
VLGLTRHLARELGSRHIRVNAVCPGAVVTDLLTRSTSSEGIAALAAQVPVGRAGTPEDIASVIAFLASEDAGYITGVSLDANGGIFMALAMRPTRLDERGCHRRGWTSNVPRLIRCASARRVLALDVL